MAKAQAGGDSSKKKKESAGYAFKFSAVEESPKTRSRDQRANLEQVYLDQVVAGLQEEFGYQNRLQVPKLSKIVLNIGLGEALKQPKLLEQTFEALGFICGQRPVVTRARKSIAGFKLREGMKLGCMATLRRDKMWDFLEKLLLVALPRTRDFRGVSRKAFDGRGNYTLGVRELLIFPEIDIDKLTYVPGMNICIHTTAKNDEEGRSLLTRLGMPFRET